MLRSKKTAAEPRPELVTIGNRIASRRDKMGMSQGMFLNHLALLGYQVTQTQLSNWERGIYELSLADLVGIARGLNVDPNCLLGVDEAVWEDTSAAAFYNGLPADLQPQARNILRAMFMAADADKTTHGHKAE